MNTITPQLLSVIDKFRMTPNAEDQFEAKGKSILINKIDSFVDQHQPLSFVMLGYPFKSANERDKVLSKLPDYAEEVSMQNFANFNKQIQELYQLGASFNIVNDGLVFNDLLDIEDNTVHHYKEVTADMGKIAPMVWHDLNNFYTGTNLQTKREQLMNQFGINDTELEHRILMDMNVNFLYKGMIRFMNEELAIKEFSSRSQQQKAAKILVRKMMARNEAYSNLVKDEFKSYIRLSMHPSTNNGDKYSIKLIPGDKAFRSPWHCALYVNEQGEYETMHKKEAEALGLELVTKNNQPYYYKSK